VADAEKPFLKRWSERKLQDAPEAEAPPPAPEPPGQAPADGLPAAIPSGDETAPEVDLSRLPDVESLTADSDFTGFLQDGVPDELKRILMEHHEEELRQAIGEVGADYPNLRVKVLVGRPYVEIIREVLRHGHDLVVKTAEGRGEVESRLLALDEITAVNPRIQTAHITGAGHSIRREQFDSFMEIVTQFMQKN